MEQVNTYVKPSQIHGLGLFASEDIKEGERIIHGNPDYSFVEEWVRYKKTEKIKSFTLARGYCMINHSEEPNTHREGKDLHIIASRDIQKGEEITEDYYKLGDDHNPFETHNNLEEFLWRCKEGIV